MRLMRGWRDRIPVPEATGSSPPLDRWHDATPAMRQYLEQKQQAGDALLLFRMGDFYETFYEDARTVSRVLGIVLTARSKGENAVPLAGIPYHALDSYLHKLVAAGYRVAISEQVEDPKLAKGVVQREILRVVTPGTLTDDTLLDEKSDNILASLCVGGRQAGLAVVELASGRFQVFELRPEDVVDELVRHRPAEILIEEAGIDAAGQPAARLAEEVRALCGTSVVRRAPHEFAPYNAEHVLHDHFGVTTLAGFGFDGMTPGLCAAGCAIAYLRETQKTSLAHIIRVQPYRPTDFLCLDHSTFRSLEIERTLRAGDREGSLLHAVDRTVHPAGARALRRWLCLPLTRVEDIVARQDAVAALAADDSARAGVRGALRSMSDVERIAARIALRRATPRDLAGLARTLGQLPALRGRLEGYSVPQLAELRDALGGLEDLADLLDKAIRPDAPLTVREGGIIADGYDAELDRLRAIGRDGQSWLADYQRREAQSAGIPSLKVGFNKVFGYYIEITNTFRDRAPAHYVRKQTVKNAERYITDELKTYETEVLSAEERAHEREFQLFEQVRDAAAEQLPGLQRVADAVGRLDVLAGLAEAAVQQRYVRPELVEGRGLEIRDGRHPVLEQTLRDGFVPNDCCLDATDARVLIITGPNMAGKSTYIRQTALLVLLAQTGSFVPAAAMRFAPVDRIFARVGASDEITRGQSTFMVEMTEAANILNNATERSLVVLDEIGRGTSTFDGLSLAWAITEHLANVVRCRTLVATHYHELTELADLLAGVKNCNVAVREWPGDDRREDGIIFLHKIVPGGTDKSYGVHVARLAGVPRPVVERSREILDELQKGFSRESHTTGLSRRRTRRPQQLELFEDPLEGLARQLRAVDLNALTPLEALQKIKEWQEELGR